MNFFILQLFENPNFFFTVVILVTFSVCLHEYAHAWMALREGDDTAAMLGHLTLNPLKQMGVFSIMMLLLLGITWGAVPVNPRKMRHKYSSALVSFAGPLVNLSLFLIFCLLSAISSSHGDSLLGKSATGMFLMGGALNAVLFIFNMLPIPILDGYAVFSYLFPAMFRINQELRNGITFLLFMVVFFSFGYIWTFGFILTSVFQTGFEILLHFLKII